MKTDKMSMANSLEARLPFLDHRIVEFASQLPLELKVGNTTKIILKELAKSRLPASIVNRPKRGFTIPVYDWIMNDLNSWAVDLIKSSPHLEIFDKKKLVIEAEAAKTNLQSAHKTWLIIVLSFWMERWL